MMGAVEETERRQANDQTKANALSYVLITPARNEAAFIESTLRSVASQSVRPLKYVVVSDGSTDGTDDIVKRYSAEHDWIELVRMPERTERDFAGKVKAFNAGYAKVKGLKYDLIGSLDADITFDSDYFRFLSDKFALNSKLGLAGTPHVENERTYDYRFASLEHVSGACQLFRRQCFEAIGGYVPMKSGGVDLVAVLSARLKGWETRTFPEKTCEHHRQMNSATKQGLGLLLNDGRKDYLLGGHPLWEIFRAGYRAARPPYLIGGIGLFVGYFWPMLLRRPRTAPPEIVAFRHKEQMTRLRGVVGRLFGRKPVSHPAA